VVRFVNGKWYCGECGAELCDVLAVPLASLVQQRDKPMMHVVTVEGDEIHRCEVRHD
jgi:hypothetical protein